MPTPEETLSVLKSKYDAARALARANHQKLKDIPAQKPLDQQRGLTLRLTKGGIVVARLHYSAEPSRDSDLNPQWKRAERRTYTSQAAWDREQEIVDEAGGSELVCRYRRHLLGQDRHYRPGLAARSRMAGRGRV